ncbi:DUF5009 domain-containing protein [uncultured Alistipes sp.]|uniref:acyltransferase family protein n=1 Tax=uncultured Alistipes sp. TaxID=538949 RepID=UPI002609D71D|nr:DUF5009 domain-containing protein [uncultured Alistipes sp.]
MTNVASGRLLSLDVLRGMTVAGMILVNNPGSWGAVYAPLRHAPWHGLTPTDLVFPFFMFVMGVSAGLSLRRYGYRCTPAAVRKILLRSVLIFLIGTAVGFFSRFCGTFAALSGEDVPFWERVARSTMTFDRMRILGVLQRLSLSYAAAMLIALSLRPHRIPLVAGALLAVYWLVLALGDGFSLSENNVVAVVDRAVLGAAHMYREGDIAFDPEGLLSTVPSVAHVLFGFCCCRAVLAAEDTDGKALRLLLIGALSMLAGWLLSYACPINKKIWSPTFVLLTCGMASSLWGVLLWAVDGRGHRRWCRFFEVFGVNPLFLYVQSAVLAILLGNIRVPCGAGATSLHGYVYSALLKPFFGAYLGSLVYALLFVGLNWAAGYVLYRKKIWIRI